MRRVKTLANLNDRYQCTSVRDPRLTETCSLRTNSNSILLVYPETKGVPLEEMDRVFGEGNFAFALQKNLLTYVYRRARISIRK